MKKEDQYLVEGRTVRRRKEKGKLTEGSRMKQGPDGCSSTGLEGVARLSNRMGVSNGSIEGIRKNPNLRFPSFERDGVEAPKAGDDSKLLHKAREREMLAAVEAKNSERTSQTHSSVTSELLLGRESVEAAREGDATRDRVGDSEESGSGEHTGSNVV
jgi:hypothetical protein